jgi:hypothetical protein
MVGCAHLGGPVDSLQPLTRPTDPPTLVGRLLLVLIGPVLMLIGLPLSPSPNVVTRGLALSGGGARSTTTALTGWARSTTPHLGTCPSGQRKRGPLVPPKEAEHHTLFDSTVSVVQIKHRFLGWSTGRLNTRHLIKLTVHIPKGKGAALSGQK